MIELLLVAVSNPPRSVGVLRQLPIGAPGRIRTCGLLLRRQTLYPLSYGGDA